MPIWRFFKAYPIASVIASTMITNEISADEYRADGSIRLTQSQNQAAPGTSRTPEASAYGSQENAFSSGVRGTIGSGVGNNEGNLASPYRSPSSMAGPTDFDLSRQRTPPSSPRSLSQFSSTNQSSSAFRSTNIFGDFFGGQNGLQKLVIPITYANLQGIDLGNGTTGFLLPNDTFPSLFSAGAPKPDGSVGVAEPINGTTPYVPSQDGIQGFTFGSGIATPTGANNRFNVNYFYDRNTVLPANISSLYGRQKIAENVSPIPRNRIFLNYSYFNNTPLAGGLDVKRWSPGFETLVGSEWTSFEMRLPMATTLSSNIFNEGTDVTHHEVGNLYMAIKQLIYRDEQSAISIGCSATLPTADDINISVRSNAFGTRRILNIDNQSVHILPFVGWYQGAGRFYTQGFCQVDIDTNGNSVFFNPNILQDRLVKLGTLQDSNYMYFDIQTGYWLRRTSPHERGRGITGVACVSELHWNRSLNAEDQLFFPNGINYGTPRSDVQILNGLLGLNFEYNYKTNFSFGYAAPIGNGADHEFNGEGRFIYNRFF
ncbi:MAG: hypothetical protein SGI77_23005 [Pirellulaceae bacterium]|nr:hypothetical protein [Pirellulaceae bacterium]